MQAAARFWSRLGLVTVVVAAAAAWPHPAVARGHSRDPVEQAERQHHRSETVRMKHRKEMDIRGSEIRDAKKSEADSRQNQMQTELGPVNEQTDRWSLY
jgi:hypothetical protein